MRYLPLLAILVVGLMGCSSPPATPTPTPQEWLDQAVAAWNGTESFHFTLALDNRTIALDGGGLLAFSEAEGDVVAPDRLQATTLVQTPLGNVTAAFIAIGEEQWLTNPLNGEWEQAPPEMQTEVHSIFDAEAGIGALLADLENLERPADEDLNGVSTVRLRGTLPGAVLSTIAPDLAEQESVAVDLWISPADSRVQQIVITEAATEGEAAIWTFRFSQFNAAPAIEPPV